MAMSKATTVKEYLAELPDDRRKALQAVRKVIKDNLDKGFKEGIQYGMIGFYVPHSIYPDGYHCDPKIPLPAGGLASQKNHMSLTLMFLYGDPAQEKWFRVEWKKTGKKLDMGKACIRFKKLEDLPLDLIGKAAARVSAKKYIEIYESTMKSGSRKKAAKKKTAKKAAKKKAAKKTAKKKATKKKATRKKAG